MRPFCDFLGVTVPAESWDELRLAVSSELDSIGMSVEVDEPRNVLWRSADSVGTVRASRMGKVWALGMSGAVCAGLRAAGRFNEYLAAIGTRPHRVTRLDASIDYQVDAAPIVAEVTRAGRAGEMTLTRKAIRPGDVTSFTGVRVDGVVSGTVYLGPRRGDARMVVYDKQHERASRKLPDTGPLTRYELRLRAQSGVTLRDASDPSGVFWHFASPDILPSPLGVDPWSPGGTGFFLEPHVPLSAPERLMRRVGSSAELASLIALAEACGPYGVELLVSQIRKLAGGAGATPAAAALASCGRSAASDAAGITHSA